MPVPLGPLDSVAVSGSPDGARARGIRLVFTQRLQCYSVIRTDGSSGVSELLGRYPEFEDAASFFKLPCFVAEIRLMMIWFGSLQAEMTQDGGSQQMPRRDEAQ